MKIGPVKIDADNVVDYAKIAFIVDRDDFLKDLYEARKKVKESSKMSPHEGLNELVSEHAMYLGSKYGLGVDSLIELILLIVDEETAIGNPHMGRILSGENIKKIMGIAPETKTELDNDDFIQIDHLMTKEQLLKLYKDYQTKIKTTDTRPNIVRDREWYWLNKRGKSYETIAEEIEHGHITVRAVGLAIQAYKKKLNMKI